MGDDNSAVAKLEKDIADFLLNKLESSNMTLEHASLVAKFVLSHLPENLTDEQLEKILPSLDDEFVELAGIVHKYLLIFEENKEKEILKSVQALMKSGRLDEASERMKSYFNKKAII